MDSRYTYVMAGGGAAGLSVARALLAVLPPDGRILIVDPQRKERNDRTWCFWIDPSDSLFADTERFITHRWSAMWFRAPRFERRFEMSPYEYRMVRGIDYYRAVIAELERSGRVDFEFAAVDDVIDGAENARVRVGGREVVAEYVFDSRFMARDFRVDTEQYRFLKQHFVGWTIQTAEPVFDPQAVTLFDLRVPQEGAFRFMYILPESPTRALVEYTLFSSTLLERGVYEQAIRDYVRETLGDTAYTIEEAEDGIIPMTDQPFARRAGMRVLNTGTRGGLVKASTGFAFMRMMRDARRIAFSMERFGHPFADMDTPPRYRTFDAMLLHILDCRAEIGREVFVRLFQRNPLPRLWRFLDEQGSVWENIQLMKTVPWMPFIAAYFAVKARAATAWWRRIQHGA